MTDVTQAFSEEVLRLDNICMNAVAARLWNTPFFKNEIAGTYTRGSKTFSYEASVAKHTELEQRVIYNLRQLPLTQSLLTELEDVVLLIGCKFSEYICQITGSFSLDISYVDQIYWTSYGVIDKSKIYYSFWKKKPDFIDPSICINWRDIPLVYFIAACYIDEEFIQQNQTSIIEIIENSRPEIKIGRNDETVYTLISILIQLYQFCKIPVRYLGEAYVKIPALPMFQICYKSNLIKAARYYWKKLNEDGNAHLISELIDLENNLIYGETFYFLLQQMSPDERNNFIKNNLVYLTRTIGQDWPFSKLLLMIYDSDLIDPDKYFSLVTKNFAYITGYNFRFPVKYKLVSKLFYKLWSRLSPDDKLNIVKGKSVPAFGGAEDANSMRSFRVSWYDLMHNSHFHCLRVIMNDKDLESLKDEMYAETAKILMNWLSFRESGMRKINMFMVEVLVSGEERKKMENELNLAVQRKYRFPTCVSYRDVSF